MKRVLSLVLALVMVFGTIMPAFAEDAATTVADSQAALDLQSYGVIAGTDKGLDEATALTRAMMATILADLYGKKTEATAYAFLPSFTDVQDEAMWYTPYVAFAEQQGWMSGDAAGGTFRPNDVMSAQEVNALFVKALGYTVEWTEVNAKAVELEVAVTAADDASVLRGEAFAALRMALDTPKMDETDTLGTALALTNYVSPTPAAPDTVTITGAVAINSVLVEVSLDDDIDAPTAVTADQFTVVDADDAAMEVASVEFAAWDADNYTVLVTLSADADAGSLYTISSGDTAKNFGGLDEDKDEVASFTAESTDYNELTLTFSEGVDLDTVVVEVEENNSGDELAVTNMAYDGKDTVVLTTDEQSKVLYKVTVTAVEDLAGNAIEDDLTATLVGQKMDDSEQEVVSAAGNYTDEVLVTFAVNVNTEDLDAANFVIVENNDTDEEVVVLEARMITSDDKGYIKADKAKQVILVTENTTKKLYKLTVSDVGTKYGEKLDTDNDDTTFVGVNLPTDDFGFATAPEAKSNTVVTMEFPNKMDADTANDIANYTIVKNNDADSALVVTAAELQDDMITVELTTEEMTKVLYKITVENVMDVYGNKIDSDEEDQTFVGAKVADAIEDITATLLNAAGTELTVTFDQKVGDNATDIANYSIDGGIGYPTKVVAGDTDYKVVLTIKETVKSDIYKLTVTNLENSDGVAMKSDDKVTENFVGKGDASALAKVVAAEAVNKNLLKIYFDTKVKDLAIVTGTSLVDEAVKVTVNSVTTDLEDKTEFAIIDETDSKVLLVYVNDFTFEEVNNDEIYDLLVTSAEVDNDNDDATFAYESAAPTKLNIVGIEAIDNVTLKVYFNQSVRHLEKEFAKMNDGADKNFASVAVANDEGTEWYFVLATGDKMTGDAKYDFIINATPDSQIDATSVDAYNVAVWNTDTTTVEFAGDDSVVDYIKTYSVMMEDEKTIVVTYPEDMDSSDAIDTSLYSFVTTSAGSTPAVMTGDANYAHGTHIGNIVYDADDFTATITLNTTFKSTQATVYLNIEDGMANALATKNVQAKTGSTYEVVSKQLAVDDADAPEVKIDSITADADINTVAITLDQLLVDATVDVDTDAEFFVEFDVQVNGSSLAAADYSDATIATVDGVSVVTVVFLAGTFAPEDAIKVVAEADATLSSAWSGEDLEKDSTGILAATGTDTTAPVATVTSTSDTIVKFVFDDTLYLNGVAILNAADVSAIVTETSVGQTVATAAYTTADDTITVTLSGAALNTEQVTLVITNLTDAAGNTVAATSATSDGTTWTLD